MDFWFDFAHCSAKGYFYGCKNVPVVLAERLFQVRLNRYEHIQYKLQATLTEDKMWFPDCVTLVDGVKLKKFVPLRSRPKK